MDRVAPRGRRAARVWTEWALLGLLLLGFALLVGLDLRASRETLEATQRARLQNQANLVERMLGTRLVATVSALDSLRAAAPRILSEPDGVARLGERMQVMVSSMVGVRTFLLVNAAGIAVASNRPELVGGDWHEGERYRAIRGRPDRTTTYVSPPFLTPLGNWALSLGRAIVDERGGFDGYVLAIVDPVYFELLLDSTRYAPDMTAAVVHEGGKVIFRVPGAPGDSAQDLAADPASPFGEHVRSGRRQTSTSAVDATTGGESFVVLQDIWPAAAPANAMLVALFTRNAAAAMATWRKERNQRLSLLAVVVAASVLGMAFHQRRRATLARIEADHDAERRRQEAELRASEQRYRELLELSPGAVFVNRGGRVEFVNRAAVALFGAPGPEPLLGRPALELFAPADRPRAEARVATLLSGGKVPLARMSVLRLDGSTRDVQIVGSTFEDEGGIAIQAVMHDVTDEIQREKELLESEAMLRAVFGGASDGIVIGDPATGALRSCNASFAALTGYSQDELARMRMDDLHPPEDLPRVKAAFADMASGRQTYATDVPVRRKDGVVFHADVGSALVQAYGRTMLAGFFRDTTERRKAEEALRVSEERFRDVVASADEYVFEMDVTGRLSFISEAVEKVLGHRPEEMLGRSSLDFMTPAERERSAAFLAERVAGKERISHFQQEAMNRDGRSVWLDISAVPVLARDGTLLGYRGAALDVSRRHVAEEEHAALQARLAQSQKLEGIGRLAGGVAHDFNNILSVILSCAGFALEGTKEGDPVREDILEIEKGAHRAAALTRQLLAFSRRQVLQPVILDLNQTLGEMEKMLRRIIGEDIDLVHVLAPDLGLVRADPGQVEQVILNIAVNARDAVPDGGKLTIETTNVDLDEAYAMGHEGSSPGPHVMMAITDSGTGMDEKTLGRIFEPFFTTKGAARGSGLGLATVYGIVKQSGGSIHVYSEVGQGTTFKVYLPREWSAGRPAERASAAPARAVRGETVLLVEDDEAMRNVTRRILEGAGYSVLPASSGAEGLAACEGHAGEIDLVLTDVVMPQMSGRVFVERLALGRPGTKVLYMSGYTDDAIVHHGVLDRGTPFIGKPFSQADLLGKIRDVLDGG